MSLTDEQIAAWLHRSVDPDEGAWIQAQVAADPVLAARAGHLRSLDDLVRTAVPKTDEVPPELLARLGLAVRAHGDNVVDLTRVRAARAIQDPGKPFRFANKTTGLWRIAASALFVVGLGMSAMQWIGPQGLSSDDAPYRALGNEPGIEKTANALVKFGKDTDVDEAKAIIDQVSARIVGQPTSTGVWRVYIDPARREAALDKLRAMPDVRMAESINGSAS
jgi:hypothetical protein